MYSTGLATAFLALSLCGAAPPVLAQGDWVPELAPSASETRGRSDPIVIILPADLDPAVYPSLAVELDDLDVTAFVTAATGRLTLAPPDALSTGTHSLRLIERGADGSILERGFWSLEIRHSDLVRDLSLFADPTGTIHSRVAENGLDVPPQHVTGDGAGNVEATAGDEGWRITTQGNYFYNSQLELSPNGRNFDLGEYRIEGDYEQESFFAGFTVGDHDTGIDNLVMSGFHRRGASFRAGLADDRLTVTGFVQRTESLIGTRHKLGISDDEERIEGASVSVRPIEALKDNIVLTGTYFAGEGSDGGFGIGTDEVVNPGSGWSVAADTLWFDEALRLRGEYAESTFDFDGEDQGFNAETADAYSVLASLEPLRGETLGDEFFSWTIGVQRDQVDTFFHSLANPYLEPDRETTKVYSNFYWGEFAAVLEVNHQLNNVDDLDYLPTDRNISVYARGDYTPYVEPLEDGSLPWYGQPSFGIEGTFYELDRIETPLGITDDANNSTHTVTFNAGSTYESWNWNFLHSITSFRDHVDLSSDTLSNSTGVSAYVRVNDWLMLQPSVSWDDYRDLDNDDDTQSLLFNLGANVTVIPETLDASLYYTLNHRMGDGDTPDTNSLNGDVTWTLRQAEANRLGVALIFSGFVQDTDDDFNNPEKDLQYQAFTSLRLSLPVVY